MPSSDPVARFARAVEKRRRAESDVRAAALVALEAGVSFAELSRAAGVSRQAVRQLVRRASSVV